ncbi:MAG TPA: glycoside hydrolase family 2 protein [Pyrinomonadaceae bacterium]|nr:glycoside hydrolase family 2 protein [Pyrinomonadaceae bacterium]
MSTKIHWWLCPILLLLPLVTANSQPARAVSRSGKTVMQIHTGWQFREAGKTDWHNASVPGCVHTDLLSNKLIEDPFYRDNEKKQQWIGKTNWEYRTAFNVSAETMQRQKLELVFDGLDTYAQVFLNDQVLLNADNMFRTWRVDAKPLLKAGGNTLRIIFRSPINEILPVMAKLSYQLPASNDQGEKTSPFTRKAPYHYGWDWGPRFVTSGIWRPVSLEAWDDARVNDLQIVVNRMNSGRAELTANVEVEASAAGAATIMLDSPTDKSVASSQQVNLNKGSNRVSFNFSIVRPAMWWPNGLGAQPLYTFRARSIVKGRTTDEKTTRTGLRTLRLDRERDQNGESFMFVINGVPVFGKGGNWIPADNFPTRITKDKYRFLLESVRDSNMNMLRVWGGGIYEADEFYDMADEMGILVWQDYMFACSMYPGNQEFLDSVRAEAIDNVKRLRNHPSIVIWAGNNEVETAWRNWGWRQSLPASLWDDYLKIFHGVLQEVSAEYDPSRPYWPSSPHGGLEDDPDSKRSGDVHYWEVWHAEKPFSEYEKQRPRFMSEYGFQSFPNIETVKYYTLPNERDIESPIMLAHQRHPRGNQLIREYMLREYPKPKDFESFLYISQVLQAEGIRTGTEHLRRIMPHNMGALYWQINDCWPVASWSSIDYFGRWKALQYYAKRFYSNLLISPTVEDGSLKLYVVSDQVNSVPAKIKVTMMNFEGRALKTFVQDVPVAPLVSRSYYELKVDDLLEGTDKKKAFASVELIVNGKVVSSNDYFFAPFKDLALSKPTIMPEVIGAKEPGKFILKLSTDKFAKAVYLAVPERDGFFSDNYFNLTPGRDVTVQFRSSAPLSLEEFRNRLQVRSVFDAF